LEWTPNGFIPLPEALVRLAGGKEGPAIERTRQRLYQRLCDGEIHAVVLREDTHTLQDTKLPWWRGGAGMKAMTTGRLRVVRYSPGLAFPFQTVVSGRVFIREHDLAPAPHGGDRPDYIPKGLGWLLDEVTQRAAGDATARDRLRERMRQDFGDGEAHAVWLNDATGAIREIEMQFWRTAAGKRAIETGRIETTGGDLFASGWVFVRERAPEDDTIGKPGRPALAPLFRRELRRRITAGETIPDTLAATARELRKWYRNAHPDNDEPPPARSIQNMIRKRFNEWREGGTKNHTPPLQKTPQV
jgi:hypothetical protein